MKPYQLISITIYPGRTVTITMLNTWTRQIETHTLTRSEAKELVKMVKEGAS